MIFITDSTLVWFRQDLRLRDNPALAFAAKLDSVIPVFIFDTACPEHCVPGGASKWWLHQSLNALNDSLDNQLHCIKGDASKLLIGLMQKHDIKRIAWNRAYEPWQIKRDTQLKQTLVAAGIEVQSFNSHLLWEPWQVLKKDQTPYKVFTPYYRRGCLSKSSPRMPVAAPKDLQIEYYSEIDNGIDSLELMPEISWHSTIQTMWTPGEKGAAQHLSEFLPDGAKEYKNKRDFPELGATSKLSPHLHFGEISPNQIWYAGINALNGNTEDIGLDCYLSELGWREFSHYLLFHFPHIPQKNFSPKFEHFIWRNDEDSLKAWQLGQTGIPIVDAGMRELWQTGTMHNRVRMVVASFLVKNLLIDWRKGERWFWDCLLDADLAANSASWQWVAGTGADASPYFRIFNPVTQGQRFDVHGDYVKRYCPELSKMPDKFIHNPWDAPQNILDYAGVKLGDNYPKPLVDLKASRLRALDALAQSKQQPNETPASS
ncbi:cryptochrome/photolyase family protein [Paraglaciecola arctica]|uniref:Deoxyribodipyrimidine photo-lyase n=1 Tax=Paraglaciecola arctica BSs20135 TaxID=493475 RepID=K6ZD64_9ALTE|nr:deoxyribodipyrimidine photo-lyase [Paraglaciecola arctica]GAC21335.1 deoxyribodipyrimidine photo-lyase [Paraglaciecola arctica BSs20135]